MPEGQTPELSWRGRIAAELAERRPGRPHNMKQLIAAANALGLRIGKNTASEIMSGKQRPNDRFIAAVSIVLQVHPTDLGFDRRPETELGFLAYEAMYPGDERRPERVRRLLAAAMG